MLLQRDFAPVTANFAWVGGGRFGHRVFHVARVSAHVSRWNSPFKRIYFVFSTSPLLFVFPQSADDAIIDVASLRLLNAELTEQNENLMLELRAANNALVCDVCCCEHLANTLIVGQTLLLQASCEARLAQITADCDTLKRQYSSLETQYNAKVIELVSIVLCCCFKT